MKGRHPAEEITTKHPHYLEARKKLESRYAHLTIQDVSMLTGYAPGTVLGYARSGRFGARKAEQGNRMSPWRFDVNAVREEIGLEPLSDFIG